VKWQPEAGFEAEAEAYLPAGGGERRLDGSLESEKGTKIEHLPGFEGRDDARILPECSKRAQMEQKRR
jgi:hypothetical protein